MAWVGFPAREQNLFLIHSVQNGFGANPASNLKGTGDWFPKIKRPGREADRSPPSSADIKNCGAIFNPPNAFMEWRLTI
jgi:hypothetical protein